jgi:putative transposase
VEELNVKNMVRNHQLAKSIMDASWSAYRKMLHYKAWSAGCEVIDVAPADTTKICSKCGNRKDMPMSERTYRCSFCGHTEDRDINAAKNILTRAMDGLSKSHARGDMSSVSLETRTQGISLKRELYGVET